MASRTCYTCNTAGRGPRPPSRRISTKRGISRRICTGSFVPPILYHLISPKERLKVPAADLLQHIVDSRNRFVGFRPALPCDAVLGFQLRQGLHQLLRLFGRADKAALIGRHQKKVTRLLRPGVHAGVKVLLVAASDPLCQLFHAAPPSYSLFLPLQKA